MPTAASSRRDGLRRPPCRPDKAGDDQGAFHGSLPCSQELRSASRMRQEAIICSNPRESPRIGWLIAREQPIVSMYIYRRHDEWPAPSRRRIQGSGGPRRNPLLELLVDEPIFIGFKAG